jgi:[protein-PII] uridylyltransferase
LLRSIGILSEIEQGDVGEQHPLANELMANSQNRVVLYVALLLHDVAKGRPEDHSIAGAKVARKVCPRLGLSKAQTEFVAWLIEQHLLMSNTAQSRDLNDPRTISDFASVMQSMDRMKALLVLTVCDIKAVGPDVWNGWKGQLLRTLYYETEPRLTGGFTSIPRKERIAEVRGELEIVLEDWPAKERKRCIGLMYDNYLMTVPREDQKRHLEFIRDSDKAGRSVATTIATREFEAVTEITLLAPDHPRLLSTITGCCTAAEANIVDAQVFTTKDGRALDSIFINRAFENEADELRRAERIGETIEDVLSGKLRLKDLFANQPKPSGRKKAFKVEPYVTINNTASDKFTVLEIEGLDRPGVLSKIADAMADLSLDIASAHIATFGEKFIDTFYVTDLVGHKIESAQKLSAIKRKLLNAVTPSADKSEKLAS